MEGKFQDILSSVTVKPGRSRLEPYAELVDELHRRKLTCRDIAAVLAEKCQFQVSKSAVNNFVRALGRRKRSSARRIAADARIVVPVAPKAANVDSVRKLTEGEVRQRIAFLKARMPVATPSQAGFHFDPTEPLRLITPGKSDK